MRIQELLEGKYFNDLNFVKNTEGGRELDYDLAEDIVHFMHNDDQVYRRHVYPKIAHYLEHKRKVKSELFGPAVKESYKLYVQKFPIRELPDDLDEETYQQVCDKLKEEINQHISDSKIKD
jgi:hypothetical protein